MNQVPKSTDLLSEINKLSELVNYLPKLSLNSLEEPIELTLPKTVDKLSGITTGTPPPDPEIYERIWEGAVKSNNYNNISKNRKIIMNLCWIPKIVHSNDPNFIRRFYGRQKFFDAPESIRIMGKVDHDFVFLEIKNIHSPGGLSGGRNKRFKAEFNIFDGKSVNVRSKCGSQHIVDHERYFSSEC